MCRYEYSYKSGRTDYFGIHFVPLAPGITRSFFKLTSRSAPKGFGLISRVPPWLIHNLGANLNDQDAIMLHGQVSALPCSCITDLHVSCCILTYVSCCFA